MNLNTHSLEYVCKQLYISVNDIYSLKRDKITTEKRWAVMWFYRIAGKSYPYIAKKIKHDQSSCRYGCINMPVHCKNVAEELFIKYVTEVLKEPKPNIYFTMPEDKQKIIKKVPDYKISKVVLKEVEV